MTQSKSKFAWQCKSLLEVHHESSTSSKASRGGPREQELMTSNRHNHQRSSSKSRKLGWRLRTEFAGRHSFRLRNRAYTRPGSAGNGIPTVHLQLTGPPRRAQNTLHAVSFLVFAAVSRRPVTNKSLKSMQDAKNCIRMTKLSPG
jgi:hypothetical protein